MNSLPLSEWMPAMWNGNRSHSSSNPAATMRSPLDRTVTVSVQPRRRCVEAVEERAVVVAAFVADQIDLDEPGHRVVPLPPGLHRDRGLQHRLRPGVADRRAGHQPGPGIGDATVDGGRRHRQDLSDHRRVDPGQVAVGGQIRQQPGQGRPQPLPGRPVEHRPTPGHQRDRGVVVDPHRLPRRAPNGHGAGQRGPDRLAGMVTMPASHLTDRVQDRRLLRPRRLRPLHQLRLRDRLPLRQRQLHPVSVPTRASWMSQRDDLNRAAPSRNVDVTNAGWSSSVARWAHNPEVTGSNPVPATHGTSRQGQVPFGRPDPDCFSFDIRETPRRQEVGL